MSEQQTELAVIDKDGTIHSVPVPAGMHQSPEIGKLAEALAKAQGEIRTAVKKVENEWLDSRYADLAAVWDACRKPLSDNGLSVTQAGGMVDGQYTMRTRLMHSSGQWVEGEVPCLTSAKETKQNLMQQLGSAITYARRYGLISLVGVCSEEDDDANHGEGQPRAKAKPKGPEPILGKYKKQELQTKLREFNADLYAAEDSDALAGVLKDYGDALKQCRDELPSWWFGADNSDAPGLADRITRRQQEIDAKEADQPTLDAG